MNRAVLFILTVLFCSCGKKSPELQTTPKVEQTKATLTPGMEAAKETYDEGQYADAVRLYAAELTTEETSLRPAGCSYPTLNKLRSLAPNKAGQYDHALEYLRKSLTIKLKKLGADHPMMATNYHNIALLYKAKKDLPKAKEYWDKAYAILQRNLVRAIHTRSS